MLEKCRCGPRKSREIGGIPGAEMSSHWTEAGWQRNTGRAERKPPAGLKVDKSWRQNWQTDGEHH